MSKREGVGGKREVGSDKVHIITVREVSFLLMLTAQSVNGTVC